MTVAAIEDVPILTIGSIRWSLRDGVLPVVETFFVSPAGKRRLETFLGRPVSLRLEVGGEQVTFQNLYILNFPPGPNHEIHGVRLADRRWIWPYAHVFRRMNIRRRIGSRRVTQPNLSLQLQPVTEDLVYRRFTVRNRRRGGFQGRWRGFDALEEVLRVVLSKEQERFGVIADVHIKDLPFEVPIENLIIDDAGDAAVNRMLAHLPDAGLFVNARGDVIVYSKASGEERDTIVRAGSEIVGRGHVEIVEERVPAPREINVYFTRELELRLDWRSEGASPRFGGGDGRTIVKPSVPVNVIPRVDGGFGGAVENVMPLPDYSLVINRKTHVQGEYVSIDQNLFDAWGAPPGGRKITDQIVRLEFVPFIDSLFNRLARFGAVDPTADWNSRIAALTAHYRRTFRINEEIMDRVIAIKAERIGNVNPATGQRAPAVAYGDWSVVPNVKYFFRNPEETRYVIQHSSFADGSFALRSDSKTMPVTVSVVDQDQGILRLEFVSDPTSVVQEFIPGTIANVPAGNMADPNVNVAFNAVTRRTVTAPVQLDGDFRLSIILTVVPLAPNHKGQLQRIRVTPQTAAQSLPRSLGFNPAAAIGPAMDVRIGPGIETARIPWSDEFAPEILNQGMGFGDESLSPAIQLEDLVVNIGKANSVTDGASLNRIAVAEAARIYATFAARYQGQMEGRLQPRIEPGGSLSEVVFELGTDGVGTVSLSLPARIEPLTFFSLLDSTTRAVVMQLATHQR